jgi:2-polyprenyl-3-methyl-5-hydroxy-6-metoxy-1,4-benzoquinol methylase
MTFATIDALRANLGASTPRAAHSPAYAAKMLHPVPASETVDRTVFVLQQVAGKRVLEFGASGRLHDGIVKASAFVLGVDRVDSGASGQSGEVIGFDLDDWQAGRSLPRMESPDVIVCGEVMEHLSNPGYFLDRLKLQYPGIPVVITVPNAFSQAGRKHIASGVENVNLDHVAWYSHKTLSVLLSRAGYTVRDFKWYGGPPYVAEGLIVIAE